MPSKKKKYNARFPAGRIKKIMQSDEEIGKVAQAVPVIISRTLELFVESLLQKTLKITNSRSAKTLSTSHMKSCIMAEHRFDFLRELVKNIPDINIAEESAICNEDEPESSPEERNNYPDSDTPYDLSMPSSSMQSASSVINDVLQKSQIPSQCSEKDSNYMVLSSRTPTHEKQLLSYVPERMSDVGLEQHSAKPTPPIATTAQSDKSVRTRNDIHEADTARLTSLNGSVAAHSQIFTHEVGIITHKEDNLSNLESETIRKHVRQRKASSNSSVIRHTNLLSSTQISLPPKLYGTDLAPTRAACSWGAKQHPGSQSTPKRLNTDQQRQLFKQRSELAPSAKASIVNNYFPTAQSKLPPKPAHIVSIDFYNKPVLKIDYSSLSIPANVTTSAIKPLSARSKMSVSNEENDVEDFIFSPEPIFNIDLSNIVTNSGNNISNHPSIANISIGSIAPISNHLVAASTNLPNISTIKTNPNSSSASTNEQLLHAISVEGATPSVMKNSSLFELDEDYDNI